MTDLTDRIERMVTQRNFGEPSALKKGRRREWPYVPTIVGSTRGGRDNVEQILGRAFATRGEAVDYAAKVIEARRIKLGVDLLNPCCRALREQYGLPRELTL